MSSSHANLTTLSLSLSPAKTRDACVSLLSSCEHIDDKSLIVEARGAGGSMAFCPLRASDDARVACRTFPRALSCTRSLLSGRWSETDHHGRMGLSDHFAQVWVSSVHKTASCQTLKKLFWSPVGTTWVQSYKLTTGRSQRPIIHNIWKHKTLKFWQIKLKIFKDKCKTIIMKLKIKNTIEKKRMTDYVSFLPHSFSRKISKYNCH